MENKKLTAKIGNWQETVAMQTLMGDKVYDPRVKSTGTFTKMRVISHSDQIDSKDYKSTLNDCAPPQQHRDYVVSDEKGPRQLRMEAAIQKQVLAEEKERAAVVTSINNERYMVTTTNADFNASGFQSTKLGTSGAGGTTKKRDPYYVKDAAITYYLHTALHGKAFEFPATPIGDLNKIWLKGSSFTQGISSGHGKKSETYENTSAPPTVRELQLLKKLRFDIVSQCAAVSPPGCPGAAVQTLTQKLLDLDNPAGRAKVDDVSAVVTLYTGVEMTLAQLDAVVIAFSRMNDERIILIEFIEYLRGSLSMHARELVFRVWDLINPERREVVSEEDVAAAGLRAGSNVDVVLDSLHLYSCGRVEGVDLVDLVEYYRDVYAELGGDGDEEFVQLLRDTWAGL